MEVAAPAGRDDREVSRCRDRWARKYVLRQQVCVHRSADSDGGAAIARTHECRRTRPRAIHTEALALQETEKFLWAKLIFVGHSKYPRKLGKFRGLGASPRNLVTFVGLKLAHEI